MKSLIVLATLAFSFSSIAATTATLNLKGTIDEKMSIEVANDTLALDLDLTTTASDLKIAEVIEKSNRKAGYKVAISSANNGVLKNGTDDEVAYTLKYGSTSLVLDGSDEIVYANQRALGAGETRDIKISYTGQAEEELVSGDYTDTVTFVISAN